MRHAAVFLLTACVLSAGASCSVTGAGFSVEPPADARKPAWTPAAPMSSSPQPSGPDAAAALDAAAPRPAPPGPDASVIQPPDATPSPPAADAASAPTPSPDAASPPPPAALRILRVHDVMADQITASVVYAHRVDAKGGTVSTTADPLSDEGLAAAIGSENLKGGQVVADVLYAHDVHARSVVIKEAHVTEMKVGDK
jgi:hypothetical protein